MLAVTRGLKHRFRILQFSRQMKRDAYFGEIFVFKDVLYGTYIATPWVHSPGYWGLNPGISNLVQYAIPKELGFAISHLLTAFGIPGTVCSSLRRGAGNHRWPRFSGERETGGHGPSANAQRHVSFFGNRGGGNKIAEG